MSSKLFIKQFGRGNDVTNTVLLLEDGSTWAGTAQGVFSFNGLFGEVVFNTSMCGYEEILTDPSYAGQIVVMSYPHIGNYGITLEDQESPRVHLKGLVVRSLTEVPSSHRSRESLTMFLDKAGVPIVGGVDTRGLVKHLRSRGVMKGRFVAANNMEPACIEELCSLPDIMAFDWVREVTVSSPKHISTGWPRIVVYDFGCKDGILRELQGLGCEVIVVPAYTSAQDTLEYEPNGVLLSNGPGDPAVLDSIVEELKLLIEKKIPLFGICLGHQLLARALGGKTYKLKFGHRGGNHPVKDLKSGKILITSHNHGYSVSAESLTGEIEPTFINLYDQTLEGFRHLTLPIMSVQFHPEGAPGPRDALYLFEEWLEIVKSALDNIPELEGETLPSVKPLVQSIPADAFLPIYLKTGRGRHASKN